VSFGDFVSAVFTVDGGLDQGDPLSVFLYLVYNSGLAQIPKARRDEHGVIYIDDNTLVTVGNTY
ncbi:hypothetical protein C8R43DRAFT_856609, partial [Mycena crocata]